MRRGPGQDVVRSEGRRRPVRGQVAADKVQAALVERVEEGRPVLGHDIEVGNGHVHHALEEGRTVDPLPFGQDGFELEAVRDGDAELLELAVEGDVMEGDALDLLRLDDLEAVGPGEVVGGLIEQKGQGIGQGVGKDLRRHLISLLIRRIPPEGKDNHFTVTGPLKQPRGGLSEGVKPTFYAFSPRTAQKVGLTPS